MKRNKGVLVTGGAGFIGSHMVDLLISKNYKVYVIDNFSGGHEKNLFHHKKNKNLIIEKADINKLQKIKSIFNDISTVYHFAGIGDIVPSIEKPLDYFTNNVQGTLNLLKYSNDGKVKKFIYAASSSCYGITKVTPTKETQETNPMYPYALSKLMGEQAVFHWGKVYKMHTNSIRIFNAYGPRVRTTGVYGAVFGVFFKQKLSNKPLTIVGNGNQKRDFIYVTDLTKAFYEVSKISQKNQVFNLGSGKPQSINYLAKIIGGKKIYIPKRPGEPDITHANITKIKKLTNWKPSIKFEVGVNKMLIDIKKWKDAPLWSPNQIKKETKSWFKYLS